MVEKFVGTRIKELRKKASLTQEELALKSGIDRTYIASVESGHRNISIKNLHKITHSLNYTLSDFFENYEVNEKHE
jgi:transcriptional regulator with XRE-family HTH domain